MTRNPLLATLWLAVAAQLAAAPARAQLEPGQVLVADLLADQIFEVATDGSGSQSVVPTGGPMNAPQAHAIDRNGFLYVTVDGLLLRANPVADTQVPLLSLFFPRGVAFDGPSGDVFVIHLNLQFFPREILRVDPVIRIADTVARSGYLVFPVGLLRTPNGKLLVADSNPDVRVGGEGEPDILLGRGVFEIDPDDFDSTDTFHNQAIVSQNGTFATPYKLARASDDHERIFVTDLGGTTQDGTPAPPRVIRVDPGGTQTVVAEGLFVSTPIGVAVETDSYPDSTLLVSDADLPGLIRISQVDLDEPDLDANQEIVSQGGLFDVPWDVQIVPPLEPLAEDFFLTDSAPGPGASDDAVYRVDPDADPDGERVEIWSGAPFETPAAIALDLEGKLVVTDTEKPAIFRIDPALPPPVTPELITEGGELVEPTGIVVEFTGDYFVTDRGADAIIRVKPSGLQEVVTSGDLLVEPVAAAIDDRGLLVVATAGDPSAEPDPILPSLVLVHPVLRSQQLLALGGILPEEPTGVTRDRDGSVLIAGRGSLADSVKVLRFFPEIGIAEIESRSDELLNARGITVDIDRDILVVDLQDEPTVGDGIVQKVDPIEAPASSPIPVPSGGPFQNPFGIAIDVVPTPAELDVDEDGQIDYADNCVLVANGEEQDNQRDTNGDGVGNACDADYDDTGLVGVPDYAALSAAWGSRSGDPKYDPDIDSDGDGGIGIKEYTLVTRQYGGPPGPSGLCDGTDPACPLPGPP